MAAQNEITYLVQGSLVIVGTACFSFFPFSSSLLSFFPLFFSVFLHYVLPLLSQCPVGSSLSLFLFLFFTTSFFPLFYLRLAFFSFFFWYCLLLAFALELLFCFLGVVWFLQAVLIAKSLCSRKEMRPI